MRCRIGTAHPPASKNPMSHIANIFMFSGQGSHHFQMGQSIYAASHIFRDHMQRMDSQVRELTGQSVIQVLYAPGNKVGLSFDRTLLTHPAIFMVEFALAQTLLHEGVVPHAVLGGSLGSFAAAAIAGFIHPEEALAAVVHQALMLETHCEPGGMIAVLADRALYDDHFLSGTSDLAAVNFASHFVVATQRHRLPRIEAELSRRNVSWQRLPVGFAFHSKWIDSAQAPFAAGMRSMRLAKNSVPLMCCDHMAMLTELSADYFWNVIRRPIRFLDAIGYLERAGGSNRYIDLGPAGTFATFLKHSRPATSDARIHSVLSPYGRDLPRLSSLLLALGKG
jgi:bacillaene synthase trans-acting acyltransferase